MDKYACFVSYETTQKKFGITELIFQDFPGFVGIWEAVAEQLQLPRNMITIHNVYAQS